MVSVPASPLSLLVLIMVFVALSNPVTAGSDSDESVKARDRKSKSKDLPDKVDKDGNNLLVATMVNISLQLSGEEAIEWHAILEDANTTSHNASLTSDEVIVLISAEIKLFFKKFPDVDKKFRYSTIGEWGDFNGLFQLAIWIHADFVEAFFTPEPGQMFKETLLKNYAATIADQTQKEAVLELSQEIEDNFNNFNITYEERMAESIVILLKLFKEHPSWKEGILGIEIPGFGTGSDLYDVALQYYRIQHFTQLFIVASGETDSQIVVDMTAEMNNAKYNFSRSEKTMLTDLIGNIEVLIARNESLTTSVKIKAVVYQYSQLMKISSFMKYNLRQFSIGAAFDFGTFGDLIDASDFGSRFPLTNPPLTTPAPTTTPVQGDCTTVGSLLTISNGNMTTFYQSSDTFLKNNPGIQARNWRPYLNMCQNTVIMNGSFSVQEKIKKISSIIRTYVGKNSARVSFVYSIKIGVWGSYKQFTTCGGF
ncbi:hypothetical protein L596_019720 [Steinernema carpocapsae]|uniref:Uncharacterized protein n=1 Tax=Steinernema carpocapsae TaxID=34508 RepID=A0A4U5MS83_STECR|nr:hypothetical protein L596_019720 [Steinernema carpocapsae]